LIIYHTTLGDKVTTWTEDGREHVVIESRPAALRLRIEPETTGEFVMPDFSKHAP
jgi:hypothetical protein